VAVRRRPRRPPGQHFLRSAQLATQLVRSSETEPGDLVVDIGAGTGVLTRALAQAGARVLALELDSGLARKLARRFEGASVVVLEADARSWSWPRERFRVLANLPFAGSTAILTHLLQDPRLPLQRADVIVQWEPALKLASLWPATLKGTYWRAWNELTITHRLSREAFAPPPPVDAAVLSIRRRRHPLVQPAESVCYWRFLQRAFEQHPALARAVRTHITKCELRRLALDLGISTRAAPRDLDAHQWSVVFAFVKARETLRQTEAEFGAK
jgi:23S rRNA (adenine-N6)-dimethyltransferase